MCVRFLQFGRMHVLGYGTEFFGLRLSVQMAIRIIGEVGAGGVTLFGLHFFVR